MGVARNEEAMKRLWHWWFIGNARWCLERWGIRRGLLVGPEGGYYWDFHTPGYDIPPRGEDRWQ